MSYEIRRARLGDEAVLAGIQIASWRAAFAPILPEDVLARCTQPEQSAEMYRRLLAQGKGNGYLLSVDGRPHCLAWWDAARREEAAGDAELIALHSLPDRWRQGYGSAMMDAVLEDMRAAGYKTVMLWVFRDNHRARQFYEKHGFAPSGRIEDPLGAAELWYEREL